MSEKTYLEKARNRCKDNHMFITHGVVLNILDDIEKGKNGISNKKLAKRIGMKHKSFMKCLRSDEKMTLEFLGKIALALNMDLKVKIVEKKG